MEKLKPVRRQFPCHAINQFVIFNRSKVPWNWFSDCGTDRNIIKISCHSRLFFVLHLLLNSVIIMAITRKPVEYAFILIQFFSYLRKQGWLLTLGTFIVTRNERIVLKQGRLNRNLYVMLKFTKRPRIPWMTSKKHCFPWGE